MDNLICPADWTEELPLDQTLQLLKEFAQSHATEAGPYAHEITECITRDDWAGLANFSIDYSRGSVLELYHARQALALFQKLEQLPLGVDKELVALTTFRTNEEMCRLTNQRLSRRCNDAVVPGAYVGAPVTFNRGLLPNSVPCESSRSVEHVLHIAQRKVASILGEAPLLNELNLAFGPGANIGIKACASSPRWKLQNTLRCSANMVSIAGSVLEQVPMLVEAHRLYPHQFEGNYSLSPPSDFVCPLYPTVQDLIARLEEHMDRISVVLEIAYGKLSFAKKNAKTYRVIVVEPPLNTLFQKGCGAKIRERLRRTGLDLNTLAEVNKTRAQVASIDGRQATVDLTSASDLWAYRAVELLMPHDWFDLLCTFRTGSIQVEGETVTLQKFSSMGNAYTFELESLLFYSVAFACTVALDLDASEVTSFGDDILLPVEAVPLLYETLAYLGHKPNEEKSFSSGRFRESCGGDFVDGIDIRPYYQKDLVSGQTLFALHNYYVRTLQPEFASRVLSAIHPTLILWGPDGYGDGHLVGSWSHVARPVRDENLYTGPAGVVFETFSLKTRHDFSRCQRGDRVLPVYTAYVGERHHLDYLAGDTKPYSKTRPMSTDHYVVRGDVGYKRISIYTFRTDVFVRL